ncbi:hypothetical protein Tco_0852989, partial [Tanacetum coccineum]
SPETNAEAQEEAQGRTNPGDAGVSQTVVHARPNLDHMDLGIAEASSQPNTEQMDKEFTAMTYPKVQENLKLPTEDDVRLKEPTSSAATLSSLQNLDKEISFTNQFLTEKSQEDEPEKTNTKAEVQSLVTVPIHQDTSLVPLMTTPVIDLTVSQPASTTVQALLPTSTTTTSIATTTTLPPPSPQPQQGISNLIIIQRIRELERCIADQVDANQALEERLDKQGNRIHQLETQDLSRMIREQTVEYIDKQEIDQKIEETVKEVVTASVQYAMRAPLRARFKDLHTSDMKEILLQRILEENYDKGHEDHRMAYEALQKSILRDESVQFDAAKAEERKKMKSKQDSPKNPPRSPPLPPPPPPPSSVSGTSDTTGTSDSAQDPLPPPQSPTTNSDDQSPGSAAPASSKTAATTAYTTWTMTTSRFKPSLPYLFSKTYLCMKNERPATPEPAWSIPSSSLPVPIHNWVSALASSYVPPPENSLLSQTDDIGVFIDWFCKKQGITELTPEHLEDDRLLRYNVSRPLPLGGPPGQVTIQTEFFFNRDLDYLRFGSKGDRLALSITKIKAAYYPDAGLEQMVPDQMWIKQECMYDISATYGISHWWFKRHKFYIDRYSAETNRRAIIKTHMRILSVIRIKVFLIYRYDYMKKIVLQRADNQEYTIVENDFKDLYPSNFEDLYLLNLQGHLNHLPLRDKKILSTAVNLWIRNLVIRQRVEDFQLGIESYQTQLNLTKPRWEATGLEFMHDYKILDSPRAVLFRDKYGMQMLMRFNKIHKFSDGTLQQIDEALDYRVKEFKVNKNNSALNTSLGESFGTWKALLVEEYAKETTDFYGEPNDDIFSVASRTSCVTQAGSPPSMCQTISNIDAHVEGEQFHESKQSSYKDGKVRYSFPRSRQSRRDLPRDNPLVSVEVLRNPDGRSCWTETCQFTTPCSHFIFLIKDIMIAEKTNTQFPQLWKTSVKQKNEGEIYSQDKYVAEILKTFDFALVKTASTLMETNKALLKDEEAEDVDVHLYRSMIRSLMYLRASRPDIMFDVSAYSPFDLEAFSDSDYAGASLDRKSTTGGVMDPKSSGLTMINFMNTKIYIDNESTICIVKNPVFYSKTKHIEIRHHFIRDSYEKKLIQVIKIHIDQNVADLLTKAFDASRVKTAKVGDEPVLKELGDRMERAATICNTSKNVSQWKYVRERYFIIQQLKIQENDL